MVISGSFLCFHNRKQCTNEKQRLLSSKVFYGLYDTCKQLIKLLEVIKYFKHFSIGSQQELGTLFL